MELVTASDLVVTASLALLLSFLVAKLVSFAIPTDPHTTNHVNELRHVSADRFTVQTAQPDNSKVEFQVATNIETEHNIEEEEEETTVESNVVELSVTQEFDPQAVDSDNLEEFSEQRKTDCVFVEEIRSVEQESIENGNSVVEERDVVFDDDDDWEGIERSELEKVFMAATEFVVGNERDGLLGSDVEMELYGLHKVATEGPCRQPQPMTLNFSARAKWNAWQKLGNMSPEVAMEHYITIVEDKFSGWMKDTYSAGMGEHEPSGSEISESVAADLSTSLSHQQLILTNRELEQEKESSAQDHSPLTESDLENNVKK